MPDFLRRFASRVRELLRPPRRLRFTRAGWLFTGGALAVGVAAIPTGNNLLFLLLGAMLGFIAVSGWLSEQTIRQLSVERRISHGFPAGRPARIPYHVSNHKRRVPSFAVEIVERGLEGVHSEGERSSGGAWIAGLPPGESVVVRAAPVVERRGVYPLRLLTIATSFPFGLFRKERDIELPGELLVWPRTERSVRPPRPGGGARPRPGSVPVGAAGARGEFRGLREYRPGDDPRDVHWRSSARMAEPVVREYERDEAETVWICLDLRRADVEAQPVPRSGPAGLLSAVGLHAGGAAEDEFEAATEREEVAVEIAASLARTAVERGRPVALATPDVVVEPGAGPAQLERLLDQLARARFRPDARPPSPPIPAAATVLVTAAAAGPASGFGDVYTPEGQAS